MNKLVSLKNSFWSFSFYSLAIILVSRAHLVSPSFFVLQSNTWSPPKTIPSFDSGSWPPILLTDESGNVHAFSSQWVDEGGGESYSAIVYNRWTINDGWTQPIDIILSPSGEARLTDAYLDSENIVHIIFWAGENKYANIYYSWSPLNEVDQVQSWSLPTPIAEDVGDPASADLVETDNSDLLLVYHGRQFGSGLYVIKSQDSGRTWSIPKSIFQANVSAPLIWNIQVAKGTNGWFHAIWNVITVGGQGRGIYYSRTQDEETWSEPILLAYAGEGYGTQTPALIEYNDMLLAFFSGIYMRKSMDHGATWSDAGKIFFRHIGVNGSLSPVIDGNGILHLFFGQRIPGDPDIHGMWHSVFVNNRWTEPEPVVKGPQVTDAVGDSSFDPYEARAVVSQGNVILVTWRTDPGLRGNGVWYSYKKLDIPGTSVISPIIPPPAEVTLIPNDASNNENDFVVTEVATENANQLIDKTQSTVYNFGYLIFLGVLPVIIFIVILVISRFRSTTHL